MKNIKLSLLGLLLIFPLFLSSVFAEDYTRWDFTRGGKITAWQGKCREFNVFPLMVTG